jgi:hypothetical protein
MKAGREQGWFEKVTLVRKSESPLKTEEVIKASVRNQELV